MASRRESAPEVRRKRRPPARSPEEWERRLSAMAYELAERQFADGTASAQVITHFLKAGSSREVLEQERLRTEAKLTEAKVEQLAALERREELFTEAIRAMRSYQDGKPLEMPDEFED